MADEKEWSKEKIKSRIDENELDLSLCSISKVPVKNLLSFTKVTVLDLSCNKINLLPVNFPDLTHIVQLDLSKNCLTELPADFGRLVKLKKLDLLNNGLSELPLSFARLQYLSWLDLKGNPIQETLPNIVGDCLTPAECTKCAKNIISHYEKLNFDQIEEEKRQKKQEETRKSKQLKKAEALRRKKREERQNKQKQIAEEKNAHNENTTDTSQEISTSMEEDIGQNECEQTSGSFWKWIILLSLLAVVMAAFVNSHEGDLHLMRKTCLVYIDRAKLHIETARDKILVKIDEMKFLKQ